MGDPRRTRVPVEVRYAETDQMGVVHHANYLVWFELARTRLCAESGFPYQRIEADGHLIMVTGVEVRYRRGARYGDPIEVVCWLDQLGSRTMRFAYEVRRGDELLVTGHTDHVWLEAASGGIRRIPSPYQEAFAALGG